MLADRPGCKNSGDRERRTRDAGEPSPDGSIAKHGSGRTQRQRSATEAPCTQLLPNSAHARDAAHHVHPQTNLAQLIETGPNIIVRGDGIRIYDSEGREFIDALAGLGCASLGFANERLAKVAYEQMRTLGYYQTVLCRTRNPDEVIDLRGGAAQKSRRCRCQSVVSVLGAEANDTAIKLVWYYHHAIGKPKKLKIIGRNWGYQTEAPAPRSAPWADPHAPRISACLSTVSCIPSSRNYYRFHYDGETEEQFARRLADSLETLILAEGPETEGAFIAEPIMSAAARFRLRGLTSTRSRPSCGNTRFCSSSTR